MRVKCKGTYASLLHTSKRFSLSFPPRIYHGRDHNRTSKFPLYRPRARSSHLFSTFIIAYGTRGHDCRFVFQVDPNSHPQTNDTIHISSIPLIILVVHPLVLLSVTDHHARVASRTDNKRVIGILLGQDNGKSINVANSFAIPFEEDERDSKTWFLDHNYIEGMWEMFKKVNGR